MVLQSPFPQHLQETRFQDLEPMVQMFAEVHNLSLFPACFQCRDSASNPGMKDWIIADRQHSSLYTACFLCCARGRLLWPAYSWRVELEVVPFGKSISRTGHKIMISNLQIIAPIAWPQTLSHAYFKGCAYFLARVEEECRHVRYIVNRVIVRAKLRLPFQAFLCGTSQLLYLGSCF